MWNEAPLYLSHPHTRGQSCSNLFFDMLERFSVDSCLIALHSTPSCSTFLGPIPGGRPLANERTKKIYNPALCPEGPLFTAQDLLKLRRSTPNQLS